MLFNSDTMLIDWLKKFEQCKTWDFARIKRYMQDNKIRATKKNIETFANEMGQEVLEYLISKHSINEYFGIKYEYKLIVCNNLIILNTIEYPLGEKSILLSM